jgi:hypothetical protein
VASLKTTVRGTVPDLGEPVKDARRLDAEVVVAVVVTVVVAVVVTAESTIM